MRPSKSPWAKQVLCVKKKDGTMSLYVDWRRLNSPLVVDSGMFSNRKGKRHSLKSTSRLVLTSCLSPRKTNTKPPSVTPTGSYGSLIEWASV